jgi:hypothetical protein
MKVVERMHVFSDNYGFINSLICCIILDNHVQYLVGYTLFYAEPCISWWPGALAGRDEN